MGQTNISVMWGSLHLLHNEPATFSALLVPIYTWVERSNCGKVPYSRTQHVDTLTVTGLKPTIFRLWTQHWSARPHIPTSGSSSWNNALWKTGKPFLSKICKIVPIFEQLFWKKRFFRSTPSLKKTFLKTNQILVIFNNILSSRRNRLLMLKERRKKKNRNFIKKLKDYFLEESLQVVWEETHVTNEKL